MTPVAPVLSSAASKLIMFLLCLCGMPESTDPYRIDIIGGEGILQSLVAKPTDGGYGLFEAGQAGADRLLEIRRDKESGAPFVSHGGETIRLSDVFADLDCKELATLSEGELKDREGNLFKLKRSGGTFYASGGSGLTIAIHK